MQSHHWRSSQC